MGGIKNNTTSSQDENESSGESADSGLPTEENLLAAIPKTAEQKAQAKVKIQKAYVRLAKGYIFDLKDYPSGSNTLDTLDKKFPVHDDKAEALFLRYRIAMEQNKLVLAKTLSDSLSKTYPESSWAMDIAPKKEANGSVENTQTLSSYYEETYELMHQRAYDQVLERAKRGQRQYNDETYNKRFQIMQGIALAGSGKWDDADTMMKQFIVENPTDTLKTWAQTVLNFIKKNKEELKAKTDSSKIDSTKLNAANKQTIEAPKDAQVKDTTANSANGKYAYNPTEAHYLFVVFSKPEPKIAKLKTDLDLYNANNQKEKALATELNTLGTNNNLLMIKQFADVVQVKNYYNSIKSIQLLKDFPETEYPCFFISASNFKKLEAEKDLKAYTDFYKQFYK